MTIENTGNDQPTNPGDADGTTAAATPDGAGPTEGKQAEGEGDGGVKPGSDAGEQGDAAKAGEGDGTGDGQEKTEGKPELTGAPEAYDDFTVPEGHALEGPRLEMAREIFKELNLSQAGAQRLVDKFCELDGENDKVRAEARDAAIAQQRDEWGAAAKAELGDQYDATVALATTAVRATENPKLVQAFNEQGWGNHPEMIKAFAFFGRMMRDTGTDGVGSSGGAEAKKNPWDVMYPDMK